MQLSRIEDLGSIGAFDCGDEDLNGFLFDDALHYQRQFIANTFLLTEGDQVKAYFSLLTDKIARDSMSGSRWKKIKKEFPDDKYFSSYPAIKIGRLAVDVSCHGQHIGTMVLDMIKQAAVQRKLLAACRFLTVDAYLSAQSFYEHNDFVPLLKEPQEGKHTMPLYFDLMRAVI